MPCFAGFCFFTHLCCTLCSAGLGERQGGCCSPSMRTTRPSRILGQSPPPQLPRQIEPRQWISVVSHPRRRLASRLVALASRPAACHSSSRKLGRQHGSHPLLRLAARKPGLQPGSRPGQAQWCQTEQEVCNCWTCVSCRVVSVYCLCRMHDRLPKMSFLFFRQLLGGEMCRVPAR